MCLALIEMKIKSFGLTCVLIYLIAQNGRHGFFGSGYARSEADCDDPFGESRRIACKKCNNFHVWIETKKSKASARWCQVFIFAFCTYMWF